MEGYGYTQPSAPPLEGYYEGIPQPSAPPMDDYSAS
jgi:hypothetical protein